MQGQAMSETPEALTSEEERHARAGSMVSTDSSGPKQRHSVGGTALQCSFKVHG